MIPLILGFQYEDWRELRFADPASEGYRRSVSRLAARLVTANQQAEVTSSVVLLTESENEDEKPGLIDEMAVSESMMPEWKDTIYDIAQQIELVGQIMNEATEEIRRSDLAGKGFGGRVFVAKRTAGRLAEPADRLSQLGSTYASQMHAVDGGIRTLIQAIPEGGPEDTEELSSLCEFFTAIRQMAVAAETGLAQVEGMVRHAAALEPISRDLRAPLRRIREGLTVTLEARSVVREWVRLIDLSGVNCPPPEPPASTDSLDPTVDE